MRNHQGEGFEAEKENGGENSWEELRKVEFAGDAKTEETEASREKNAEIGAQKIRELTDWRAKAEREDPQGFAEAVAEDTKDNTEKERRRQEVYDGVAKFKENEANLNDLHERFDEIEKLQAARRKSWISRVKRDLGLKDRKLMDLKQKAEEIQAKIEESTVEEARLTSSGFATEERMQQKLDKGECLEPFKVSKALFFKMLFDGYIKDANTFIGGTKAMHYLGYLVW